MKPRWRQCSGRQWNRGERQWNRGGRQWNRGGRQSSRPNVSMLLSKHWKQTLANACVL